MSQAVRVGLITREFLEEQRRELGELVFEHQYGCSFLSSGNQWYKPEWIHTGNYGIGWY